MKIGIDLGGTKTEGILIDNFGLKGFFINIQTIRLECPNANGNVQI